MSNTKKKKKKNIDLKKILLQKKKIKIQKIL